MKIEELARKAADDCFYSKAALYMDCGDAAKIIAKHFSPLAEERDRLLVHLKHLMAYAVSNDPGDVMQGYTIRLDAMYRNTLVAECEKEKR